MPRHWISSLFKKFQARYGTKWVACIEGIEKEAIKEWAEGLGGYTGEQIKKGLDSLNNEWPPSLPEFQKACGKITKSWQHNSPAYMETKGLPSPEISLEKLEEHRLELKKAVDKIRGKI